MRRWFALAIVFALAQISAVADDAIAIGMRVEMFVDRALIERMDAGATLAIHPPIKREVVLTLDQPWESNSSAYYTVLRDGAKIRLYYRGVTTDDASDRQTTCMAESNDGIHFTRPNLGLYEWNGSKANNIVFMGPESAAFAPFLDTNPDARAEERYKAVAFRVFGEKGGAMALVSPDGVHWKRMQETPILPLGAFDSLNTAFWDASAKRYRLYGRYWTGGGFTGVRGIESSTSADFRTWSAPETNHYADGVPIEHFYTNAVVPCPGAPHHLLSFPMRFVPGRKKLPAHKEDGVCDAVFMSSRDGVRWDRSSLQAWVRPGLDERNWTDRSNMPAWGILQTDPREFSMYISEHYWWPDNRLRRLTVRRHGFGSIHAGYEKGEIVTRPLTFAGNRLLLNYSTSAAGSVQVEIQDGKTGAPLSGYELADMPPLFGDELDAVVNWKRESDLSALTGKVVRLRFVLKDADVYAFEVREEKSD